LTLRKLFYNIQKDREKNCLTEKKHRNLQQLSNFFQISAQLFFITNLNYLSIYLLYIYLYIYHVSFPDIILPDQSS